MVLDSLPLVSVVAQIVETEKVGLNLAGLMQQKRGRVFTFRMSNVFSANQIICYYFIQDVSAVAPCFL